MKLLALFFSYSGRIGRIAFFLALAVNIGLSAGAQWALETRKNALQLWLIDVNMALADIYMGSEHEINERLQVLRSAATTPEGKAAYESYASKVIEQSRVMGNMAIAISAAPGLLCALLLLWISSALYAKRLHDVNFSGWWAILPIAMTFGARLVPAHTQPMLLAGYAAITLVLLLWPGNKHINDYGFSLYGAAKQKIKAPEGQQAVRW